MRGLTDRRAECGVLDGLVEAVRAGESRVLAVHGEPGAGKTALLEYLADRATGCRVLRVSGIQWEMELAFAGLHQLCASLLDRLPAQARRLLLLAAADPTGDPVLVWRAAARLGIGTQAAGQAAEAGLAEFGARVRFRHPLVRSAVYRSAPATDRQEAHAASRSLALATGLLTPSVTGAIAG